MSTEEGKDVITGGPAAAEPTKPVIKEATPDRNQTTAEGVVAHSSSPTQSPHSPSATVFPFHNHQQQHPGYYTYQQNTNQQQQQQHQQPPNSPIASSMGNGVYDIQSLLAQQQIGVGVGVPGGNGFSRQQYTNNVNVPLSPALDHGNNSEMASLPPASPLFPAVPLYGTNEQIAAENGMNMNMNMNVNGASMVTPASPSLQYLTGPPPSPIISYGYPGSMPNSPEARTSWSDRGQAGLPIQYQGGIVQSRRSTSFDGGEMLPPSAIEDTSSMYSTSVGAGWGYNPAAAPDPYSTTQPSIQQHLPQQVRSPPRGGIHGRMQPNVPPAMQAHYFPAATPGPPIQTTQNNKGPDGANLFIFHIPNHFTNLDMWHLFCHYGNLLSVRIMVEKDTGRSRGFGFVSYDSPDAAAMAIKELNGFVIGNKRLKVQHKQIRQNDSQVHQDHSKGPPLFPENPTSATHTQAVSPEGPNTSNWLQQQSTSPTQATSTTPTKAKPPLLPDVTADSSPSPTQDNNGMSPAGGALGNLDPIRDALPDVK